MGGGIDTTLMCVKFSDDPISSLDFSFINKLELSSLKLGLLMTFEQFLMKIIKI